MFQGSFIVTCTLFTFIGLVWLREQIVHGGGPDWLEQEDVLEQDQVVHQQADQGVGNQANEADNNNVNITK